ALQQRLLYARARGENASGQEMLAKLPLLFGTDYYPDQTHEKFWEQDAAAMAAMGITNVRIAEFAWALMEPQEGKFDFGWLKRAVKILHANNIALILGTPSAAPPTWLTQKYPEVMMVNERGLTLSTGERRFTCPTNKTYRRLSLAVATELAHAFAATPGVIGWQIDNELTLGNSPRCYCDFCREGFQNWLREKYHSLDAINQAWGTVFWSQTSDSLWITTAIRATPTCRSSRSSSPCCASCARTTLSPQTTWADSLTRSNCASFIATSTLPPTTTIPAFSRSSRTIRSPG